MAFKKLIYLSLLCFLFYKPYAQVSLQTGSATFSIPMFDWKDNKSRLNSSVVLSYNSGNGLKVNDVASNVGQGWNLVQGGVVVRMQAGEPDDQQAYNGNGDHTDQDQTKYPAGFLYAPVSAANGCPVALTKYPIYGWKNQTYTQHNSTGEDRQLDYFSFQFNGKGGTFVLDKATGKGVSLGDTKMLITFQTDVTMATNTTSGTRTTITSFTIQDIDGLIYKFSTKSLTKVLHETYCDANGSQQLLQPEFKNRHVYYQKGFDDGQIINPYIINCWYLTDVTDPLTGRKINYYYSNRSCDNAIGADVDYNATSDYAIVTFKSSKTQTPELDYINYPDGHHVTFNYGDARADYNGEQVLASVDVTYNSRYISKYKLNTTYFIKNRYGKPGPDQKDLARLCLKSVQKFGPDLKEESPPYTFEYYLGSNTTDDKVPAPFSFQKDIWGFYNGSGTKDYNGTTILYSKPINSLGIDEVMGLCYLRSGVSSIVLNPTSSYAQNGLLRQIIYPTGGTLEYTYSQNAGKFIGASTATTVGGVHVSQTTSRDGIHCDNPLTTSYNYVLADGSTSSLWGLEMPVNVSSTSSHYEPEHRSWHYTLAHNWSLFGSCYYHYLYPGVQFRQQAITLEGIQKFMQTYAVELNILSIVSTIVDIVTIIGGSTGFLAIAAIVVDILAGIFTVIYSCTHDFSNDESATSYHSNDLNGVSPLPAQFKRVEVVDNPGTIGKTVQEFTSDDDYAIWEATNPNFSAKQRFAPWAYGLPKLTTVYNSSGNKVKETQNVYNFQTHYYLDHCTDPNNHYHLDRAALLKVPLGMVSSKCQVNRMYSQRNTRWSDPAIYDDPMSFSTSSTSDLGVDVYDMYTGRIELDAVYERAYNPAGTQYVETGATYFYNDYNYQVKSVRTKQSDGSFRQKNTYYTIDYAKTVFTDCVNASSTITTTNSQINTMVANNMIAVPVEENELLVDYNNYNVKYTYDRASLFTTLANGDIRPWKLLEGRFTQPAFRTSPYPELTYVYFTYMLMPALFNASSPDYTFYKVAKTMTYDANSNLVQVDDEGGRRVSNVYGYNDKYVVASAVNANYNEVFFEPFESLAGWNGTTAAAYGDHAISAFDNTKSRTGGYSARIDKPTSGERVCHSTQTLNISLSAATKYKISGWVYSDGPSADLFLFMKTATETGYYTYVDFATTSTTNQWVYIEKEITVPANVTRLNVRIDNNGGGSVWFDDIRVYPSAARMVSYTYDPLIGKTSESDLNNRASYYEYDPLGRLQFIRDEKRNIVKMYEYNNVSPSKLNGCVALYYSKLTTEIYTKSNCGSGYVGTQVTYTVPAGKYTSTISQEDADAQVEMELFTSGQAYANTNGSCQQIYYNVAMSETDATQSCGIGYAPGTVTYTVPAARYMSLISQADADQKAQDDIDANAQAYANDPAHRVCTVTSDPVWTWDEIHTYCQSVNGNLPPHQFVFETDLNPNSPTYNQTRWNDIGATDACPSNLYYNTQQSGTFTRNNCSSGYYGSSVTYIVPPGTYSSSTSQAAADLLATNDVSANGQAYANAHGTCTMSCSFSASSGFSIATSGISSSGGTVSFYIVVSSTSGTPCWTCGVQVATISGGCNPSAARTFNMTESGRTWQVTVSTSGAFSIQLISGTAPCSSCSVTLSGGSYSL